ncbi:hypothetical protein ABW19_dt0202586 [Dactylella cylindrospora]|nr:hypothetical protein ABW19_dt0202586 [Dactylella cylindrospora]
MSLRSSEAVWELHIEKISNQLPSFSVTPFISSPFNMKPSWKNFRIQSKRRIEASKTSQCSKSFARYCVALLGSLAVGLAAPAPSSYPLLDEMNGHGRKRSISLTTGAASLQDLRKVVESVTTFATAHSLHPRGDPGHVNRAATAVGICGGFAFLLALLGGFFYIRSERQKHRRGKCRCGEKGVRCRYQQVDDEVTSRDIGNLDEESEPGTQSITPPSSPSSPGQLPTPISRPKRQVTFQSTVSNSGSDGPFYDAEGFEYPAQYKPPPSSYRTHSPSTSVDRLVPPSFPNMLSPVSPLLSQHSFADVSITPPRTPSPAVHSRIHAQNSQSPRLRGRSLSAVDLSRSDGELREDLTAIFRELQRRPRATSVEGRRARARSLQELRQPGSGENDIMELEASPGKWNSDMQRTKGIVHEAVGQEVAVELDSRPLTLGLKRTKRVASRFK